ncbi:MAG: hypothetical protein J0L84_09540 [Verrucomicrobia bacterium]|nr:hypothetical protein [Verrucomicrobiota bacterium]
MNAKTLSILLGLLALGLGVGWLLSTRDAGQRAAESAARIARMSNDLVETTARLTREQGEALRLQTNLVLRARELEAVSNRWTTTAEALIKTEADARAAAAVAQAEIEKRDKQIGELEGEREDLTQRMDGLTGEIQNLNGKISDTERKLAASEGNRDQLQKELRRLLAEKADLERRFNDLATLREQVRKLKDELNVARRIDLIRRGLYGSDKKGSQVLNEGIRRPAAPPASTNAPVQAEIGTDGSVKVSGAAPTQPAPPK